MQTVLIAMAGMAGLGITFGLLLALASRAFQSQEDPRVNQVLDALPGANCGACGYPGCEHYAKAVVEGEEIDLCPVGGAEVQQMVAEIMGVEAEDMQERRAVVHCRGDTERCGTRCEYDGIDDCRAADLVSGGPKECLYGCLGYGSCAKVCPYDAITMSEKHLPVIDPDKCTACGACVRACPRDLITLLDKRYDIYLGCSSQDSGKEVKMVCDVGCIACRRCVKEDPNDAIEMDGNLPVLDYEKADGDFSVAAEVCPMDCFVVEQRQPAAEGAEEAARA
jgi:RnfABCDGE-type electron transport complex B subunit